MPCGWTARLELELFECVPSDSAKTWQMAPVTLQAKTTIIMP